MTKTYGPNLDLLVTQKKTSAAVKNCSRNLSGSSRITTLGVSEDLFPDAGRVRPPDSKRKFAKNRKIVMFAFAFGLDDHIPEELEKKYLEPDMPEKARQELERKYPPRPATEEEMQARAKRFEDKEIPVLTRARFVPVVTALRYCPLNCNEQTGKAQALTGVSGFRASAYLLTRQLTCQRTSSLPKTKCQAMQYNELQGSSKKCTVDSYFSTRPLSRWWQCEMTCCPLSIPMNRIPFCKATDAVVPEPKKLSRTKSPGSCRDIDNSFDELFGFWSVEDFLVRKQPENFLFCRIRSSYFICFPQGVRGEPPAYFVQEALQSWNTVSVSSQTKSCCQK